MPRIEPIDRFPHHAANTQAVAAGYLHTVAITVDGGGYSCGLAQNGRLGLGAEVKTAAVRIAMKGVRLCQL